MKKGEDMTPHHYIFIGVSVIALILAFYSSRAQDEDSIADDRIKQTMADISRLRNGTDVDTKNIFSRLERVENSQISTQVISQTVDERIQNALLNYGNQHIHELRRLGKEIEILKVQQHSLDKKIIAKETQLNVRFLKESDPIPVVPVRPPLPKGKGQEALIKKSGVKE